MVLQIPLMRNSHFCEICVFCLSEWLADNVQLWNLMLRKHDEHARFRFENSEVEEKGQ